MSASMPSTPSALLLCVRLGLCFAAVGAGIALARYTDIARHDLTRRATERNERNEQVAYDRLRASVRYTGSPSATARASRLLRAP